MPCEPPRESADAGCIGRIPGDTQGRAVDRLVPVGHALDREAGDDRFADRTAVQLVDPVDLERHRRHVVPEEAIDAVA